MYCPNCAAPIEGVKFCRSCGANVSLVPQAMSGELPTTYSDERKAKKRDRPATIEKAVGSAFTGLGFLLAAIFVMTMMPGGHTWGWSFLFPAFALLGEGIGQYLKLQEQRRRFNPSQVGAPLTQTYQYPLPTPTPYQVSAPSTDATSAPTTSSLHTPTPPSVTEPTTRHLDAAAPRQER